MSAIKVYVAGPISRGDQLANIKAGIDAGEALAQRGYVPFVPHFNYSWHMHYPHPVAFWYAYDNEWLPCCDALLRLPGESTGADNEVHLAIELGIPIFYSIKQLDTHYGRP